MVASSTRHVVALSLQCIAWLSATYIAFPMAIEARHSRCSVLLLLTRGCAKPCSGSSCLLVLQEREGLVAELAALQAQHEQHRTTSQREARSLLDSR